MPQFKRSKLSLLVQETAQYSSDLERITMLRDKTFKMWTLEANETAQKVYKSEWYAYCTVIDCMQLVLIQLTETVLKQRKAAKQ